MSQFDYKGSIKNRLVALILVIVLITGIIGYGSFVYWYMANQQERVINLSQTVGHVLSQDLAKLVLLNQVDVASDITTKLSSFERIESMVLYRAEDKKPIYQFQKDGVSFSPRPLPQELQEIDIAGSEAIMYLDAKYQQINLGYVKLVFEVDTIADVIKRDSGALITIALLLFLFSYILASIFAKKFTKPILDLVKFLEKIELDDSLDKRIYIDQDNEFGKLYAEVNTMLLRIANSQQEQKLAAVAFETPSGMVVTDSDQKILRVNKAFTKITGYMQAEAIGNTPKLLSSGRHDESFYVQMWEDLQTKQYWSGEIWNRHKSGDVYPEHLTIQAVLDQDGTVIYYVAAFLDLTVQKQAQAKADFLSRHDALTGLANKQMLLDAMEQKRKQKQKKRYGFMLCFDFNNFKNVNDSYGHEIGDQLLQESAKRLRKHFNDSDLLVRLGADEFIIWVAQSDNDRQHTALFAEKYAQNVLEVLHENFQIADHTIHLLCTIGIAIYDSHYKDTTKAINESDSALHQAKIKHAKIAFFDKQAQKIAEKHTQVYTELLKAIESDQFMLYYQPQYRKDGKIHGYEALIRWIHPDQGVLSPFFFIDVAEQTGLIVPIGEWVLQTACKQLALWQEQEISKDWVMAVNVSAKQFHQEDFVRLVAKTLSDNRVDPRLLKLELTETLLVDDIQKVVDRMYELKDLGIQISLDDFGTGYSSLQYLQKLPLNQVKIDKSFVQDMIHNKNDRVIIQSVLSLGEVFGFEVIAEGVESDKHHLHLQELGCKLFQGYYFGRPGPL